MKIIVPIEGSQEDIEKAATKYGVAIESLPNVELAIIGSPLYAVSGEEKNVDKFIGRYFAALGCDGPVTEFLKVTPSQIFVYWEKIGERFNLSYRRDEDYFSAKKESQQKPKRKKKGSVDDEEVIVLMAPEAEKPRIDFDMASLLR